MSDYPSCYCDPSPESEILILSDLVELQRKALGILLAGQADGSEPTIDVVRQSIRVRKAELRLCRARGEKT